MFHFQKNVYKIECVSNIKISYSNNDEPLGLIKIKNKHKVLKL